MTDIFVFGTLRHLPLLQIVLGRSDFEITVANLPGYHCVKVSGETYPALRRDENADAKGFLLTNLSAADIERLNFYEGPYDYRLDAVSVQVATETKAAYAYSFLDDRKISNERWSLDDWVRDQWPIIKFAARDIMAMFGQQSAKEIDQRMGSILARASSALRAEQEESKLDDPRFQPGRSDIEVKSHTTPYAGFFSLEKVELRHRKFDGSVSELLSREAFVAADAVTVLPFDPIRKRVLLVEQFRVGPLVRGDRNPWSLEAIAGRVDAGETPQEAAMREAREEANISVQSLVLANSFYTTPGAVTEYLYAYIGIADLPDGCAGLGGAADEGEDIRAHLVELDEFQHYLSTGVLENSPLILSGLWLLLNHQTLTSIP